MHSYRDGDVVLCGFLAEDLSCSSARPGILLVHGGAGLDEDARAQAERVATLGYVVLACGMFGEGVVGDRERTMAEIAALIGDPDRLCRRATAGLDVLAAHPRVDGRVAAVGYCFGGTTVLELARAGAAVAGVASIHGGLRRHRDAPVTPITARVLVCHGGADPYVPPADVAAFVDEMSAAEADWQMHVYRGAAHGFTHRSPSSTPGVAYDADADERSAAALHQFLAEVFGAETPNAETLSAERSGAPAVSSSSPATPVRTAAATRSVR
jgi:dienelactone hydrolase